MKELVKKYLTPTQKRKIRFFINRTIAFFVFGDLNKMAIIHNTDKWGAHWYTQHYHRHFKYIRKKKLNILEIGVGGYDSAVIGGNSLRTWKSYFPKSNIYGIDIYDKNELEENRIKIFKGSQTDENFLVDTCKVIGKIDVIIDDGSHMNEDVITSFKILFPLLKSGGIYVVEDLETSYWPNMGGNSDDLQTSNTSMNFFKSLVDCVNHEEFIKPGYAKSYYDLNIIEIHFYHNMVFIIKGENYEKSINIVNNMRHRLDD